MKRTYTFIINPISGAHRKPAQIVGWIKKHFADSGLKCDIRYTECAGDATRIAKECVEQNIDIIVAVGGDGTINEIGRALLHSQSAMGIIPAGSGNGFARNFKIPLEQEKAVQALLHPKTLQIDAGKINEHYFFNVAGTGLDADVSEAFARFGKRGPFPYFIVGAKSFIKFKPQKTRIIFEDREIVVSPLVISIANAPEYGNGAVIAPGADARDGLLDVIIIEPIPLWRGAKTLIRLFNGTLDGIPQFSRHRVKSVLIERETGGPIHTDGDPFEAGKRLEIEVLPSSLKIVAPK